MTPFDDVKKGESYLELSGLFYFAILLYVFLLGCS